MGSLGTAAVKAKSLEHGHELMDAAASFSLALRVQTTQIQGAEGLGHGESLSRVDASHSGTCTFGVAFRLDPAFLLDLGVGLIEGRKVWLRV